jgi:hypothetical protein
MDPKKSKYLFETFPFTRSSGNPRQDLMCFGFEVQDGWFEILNRLCQKLQSMGLPEDFQFLQVKEKFGGLRVYVLGGTDAVWDAIDAAEAESFKTCEECGSTGKLRTDMGWLRTLCDTCHNHYDEIRTARWAKQPAPHGGEE